MEDKKLIYIKYNKDNENPILLGLKHVLSFGKYKYKRIDTVIEQDPGYLIWLCDSGCYKFHDEEVLKKVKKVLSKKKTALYRSCYGIKNNPHKLYN